VESTTTYQYNDSGIRVSQRVVDANGDKTTVYHIDPNNHTGYAQILEEGEETGTPDGRLQTAEIDRTYTLGHDVITQATAGGAVYHFLYDGHGSTRALLNGTSIAERYAYDAYGNMLAGALLAATTDLTRFLYSGEQTDATGLQYLRARYYDAATGRFNRLDPFAGNVNDPLSLHKYLYTHADPVNGIDPSGESLTESLTTLQIQVTAFANKAAGVYRAYAYVNRVIDTITFVTDMIRLLTNISTLNLSKVKTLLSDTFSANSDFRQKLQPKNLVRAAEVFGGNIPKIFGNLLLISAAAGTPENQRLLNFFDALRTKRSKIVIMMPTPYYPTGTVGPNPLLIVPAGLRMQVGGERRSVSLYFGHGRYQGRMFGLGVVKSNSKTHEQNPFQLFRMDYHNPHAGAHTTGLDYWVHGRSNFHFHLVDKR
jgi:RHS repeat-associated protein